MRDLQDLSLGQRIIATVIIVVVIMLILACIGYLSGRWEAEAAPTTAVPITITPYEARLTALDREAIDNAYRAKVEQLFSVWLKDETAQPARAIVGVTQARKAYAGAMAEIERREKLLQQ